QNDCVDEGNRWLSFGFDHASFNAKMNLKKGNRGIKMLGNVRSYKLFINHLLSYVIIMLVPLVLLGGLISVYFIGVIKEDVLTNNANRLERARSAIDNQLLQLNSISIQLNIKNKSLFRFEDQPLGSMAVIEELRNYTITNKFIA